MISCFKTEIEELKRNLQWQMILLCLPELRGIQRQSTIGFLTVLEHLRYCEVS